MKKTYIEPKTAILATDICDDLMISGSTEGEQFIEGGGNASDHGGSGIVVDARETISSKDAWEEW
ncbi:MAG: hypothetical protein J6035_03055 [Bacteroidaceae bacterium]|nr:hypothetical protein [Bacteroidaceae bacterium]